MLKKIHQTIAIVILIVFVITSVKSPAYAQGTVDLALHLPQPGVMIHLSSEFTPAHLQGITIHPDNALQFDFLIHRGDLELDNEQKKEEYTKLVKYFLASLTIPDEDQWVNLSPYENNRIIKDDFGKTEMGRDLLAEDYMLKQITSSLIYPEDSLGKKFWTKIYARAWSEYHTTNIPVNTFNKVWIVPDQAIVYESGNTAYILKSHLKVMLEEDYLSLQKHSAIPLGQPGDMFKSELQRTCPQAGCQATQPLNVKAPQGNTLNASPSTHTIASQVIREVILPELEKEVNEGRNFANLRQMYSGMILATWYKTALKESLLGKVYADKAKVKGVDQDPKANTLIYQRYLKAFKKGVFNYIKEDMDRYTNEEIPRKYFSGGWQGLRGAQYYQRGNIPVGEVVIMTSRTLVRRGVDSAALSLGENTLDKATITINPERNIGAIGPSQHELRPVNDAAMRADRLRTLVLAAVPVVLVASMGLPYAIYLWKTHNLSEEASKNPKHIAYLPLETGTYYFTWIKDVAGTPIEVDHANHPAKITSMTVDPKDSRRISLEFTSVDRIHVPGYARDVHVTSQPLTITIGQEAKGFTPDENQAQIFSRIGSRPSLNPAMLISADSSAEEFYKEIIKFQGNEINNRNSQYDVTEYKSLGVVVKVPRVESAELNESTALVQQNLSGVALPFIRAVVNGKHIIIQRMADEVLNNLLENYSPDKRNLLEQYFQLQKMMISQRGVFDADPKPHNYAVLDGKLYLIDVDDKIDLIKGLQEDEMRKRILMANLQMKLSTFHFRDMAEDFNALARATGFDSVENITNKIRGVDFHAIKPEAINENSFKEWLAGKIDASSAMVATSRGKNEKLRESALFAQLLHQMREALGVGSNLQSLSSSPTIHPVAQQIIDAVEEYRRNVQAGSDAAMIKAVLSSRNERILHTQLSDQIRKMLGEDDHKGNASKRTIHPVAQQIIDAVEAYRQKIQNQAMIGPADGAMTRGGIDFNAANLAIVIKRDGNGIPLPLAQQDMAQLTRIQGFDAEITEIEPALHVPIISELEEKLQSSTM